MCRFRESRTGGQMSIHATSLHQFGVLGHPVEDGVRVLEQLVGGSELLDEALVQHHDLVVVQYGVQSEMGILMFQLYIRIADFP